MTTYYVDGVDGNDGNAGTSEGSGNAWASVSYALTQVAAGDTVYVKGNGTYSGNNDISTAGTEEAWITFEGYTTTPGDNGLATMTHTSHCWTATPSTLYYVLRNLKVDSCGGDGIFLGDNYIVIDNCVISNNASEGVSIYRGAIINCEIYGNTHSGVYNSNATNCVVAGCKVYSNGNSTNSQFNLAGATHLFYKNLVYGHAAGTSYAINAYADGSYAIGNTIDGEGIANIVGIYSSSEYLEYIADNIIHDCAVGYETADPIVTNRTGKLKHNNLFSSVTTPYYDGTDAIGGGMTGIADVTASPGFNDEANDDYTLAYSSAAVGAGITPGRRT